MVFVKKKYYSFTKNDNHTY